MLYCRLLKALYGCVQTSKLWFNKLTRVLHHDGYEHSPADLCVMRWIVSDRVILLMIYVDDILILSNDAEIERMEQISLSEFTWITMEHYNKLSYLGIIVSLEGGTVTIDMTYFMEKLFESYKNLVKRAMPSNNSIFHFSKDAVVMPEVERKVFHSVVAKLLYLSK